MRLAIVATIAVACGTPGPTPTSSPKAPASEAPLLELVGGPILGDPTHAQVLVWARAEASGFLHVRAGDVVESAPLEAEHGYAATIEVAPDEELAVWATTTESSGKPHAPNVAFVPPPPDDEAAAVRFAFGGDLAGQNVCRHAEEGFPAVRALADRPIDLFIGLGDMIYADHECEAEGRWGQPQVAGDFGPAEDLDTFRAHWRYSRADPGLRLLLERVPYVAVWDDHEVVNDFGRGEPRISVGLSAFREHNPLPETLYRTIRYGRHLSLIILDTRSNRDSNREEDTDEAPKTLLGLEQREWLREQFRDGATWHVVVSSVPIAVPTGWPRENGRDGWAGFERELRGVFEDAQRAEANVVFLTTDVHFAAVHRLEPLDGYIVHEVISGPLSAGLHPTRELSPTFRPRRLFFHAPETFESVTTWEEGRTYLNWGEIAIDEEGALTFEIRDVGGELLFEGTVRPMSAERSLSPERPRRPQLRNR